MLEVLKRKLGWMAGCSGFFWDCLAVLFRWSAHEREGAPGSVLDGLLWSSPTGLVFVGFLPLGFSDCLLSCPWQKPRPRFAGGWRCAGAAGLAMVCCRLGVGWWLKKKGGRQRGEGCCNRRRRERNKRRRRNRKEEERRKVRKKKRKKLICDFPFFDLFQGKLFLIFFFLFIITLLNLLMVFFF